MRVTRMTQYVICNALWEWVITAELKMFKSVPL